MPTDVAGANGIRLWSAPKGSEKRRNEAGLTGHHVRHGSDGGSIEPGNLVLRQYNPLESRRVRSASAERRPSPTGDPEHGVAPWCPHVMTKVLAL